MAYIQPRKNKAGAVISYSIRVYKGRNPLTGKQLTPYTTTWRVPAGWSEKRAEKEAGRQAVLFESQCREGICQDGRITFAVYAEYVMELKKRCGLKHLTLVRYRQDLERVLPYIGHLKLVQIRPGHLNLLYGQLSRPGMRKDGIRAYAKPALNRLLKQKNAGRFLSESDGKRISLDNARLGRPLKLSTALRISKVLEAPLKSLFSITGGTRSLSPHSIVDCHLLISSILSQAEKEQIIPRNPARLAAPPRMSDPDPHYFQLDEIARILQALNSETPAWRALIQLLLVTGCRRGELLGLKWNKVDWENSQITIDRAVLYSRSRGVYEDTPKSRKSVRTLKIPGETMKLLAEHRYCQKEEMQKNKTYTTETGYIFTNRKGGPMNPSQLGNWLNRFSLRHGLPHLNPHAFRHTLSSVLFFHGIDCVSISRHLGHSRVSTTSDIYSHIMKQAECKITSCISEIILSADSRASNLLNES